MIMKRLFYLAKSFLAILVLFSCHEKEDHIPLAKVEIFERVSDGSFNYNSANVKKIESLDGKLFYSHRSNPGYLDSAYNVIQLCCSAINNNELNQSFSNEYIVGAGNYLTSFNVYSVKDDHSTGFIYLQKFLGQDFQKVFLDSRAKDLFDLNENFLLTPVYVGTKQELYIFDLDRHVNFFGGPQDTTGIIKVNFPSVGQSESPDISNVGKLKRFEDGWLVALYSGSTVPIRGTYFIDKKGQATKVESDPEEIFYYGGHTYLENGKLIVWTWNKIYLSETGSMNGIRPIANIPLPFEFRAIGNRLAMFLPSAESILELENIENYKEGPLMVQQLDNQGIEFSNVNEIRLFGDKVFVATSIGLFTKSVSEFFTPKKEDENTQKTGESITFFLDQN
jgi:hypothetical protein